MHFLTGIVFGENNKAVVSLVMAVLAAVAPPLAAEPWVQVAVTGLLSYAATYLVPNRERP